MDLATLGVVIDTDGAKSSIGDLQKTVKDAAADIVASVNNIGKGADNMGDGLTNNSKKSKDAADNIGAFGKAMRVASDSINVVRGALDTLRGAWDFASGFIDAGAQLEKFRVQFGGLLGDYQKAAAYLDTLRDYANHSPFQFADVANATRTLYDITSGLQAVDGNMDTVIATMKRLGDAVPDVSLFGQAAQEVGRLYTQLQAGSGYEQTVQSLAGMAILGGTLTNELKQAAAQGATLKDMWALVNQDLERHKGNAERLSTTYEGLVSTLGDAWQTLKQVIGLPLATALKQPIVDITEIIASWTPAIGSFAKSFAQEIQLAYGAFKDGNLSTFLGIEFRKGASYLYSYMSDAFNSLQVAEWLDRKLDAVATYLAALLNKYFDDPINSVDWGKAFSQAGSNLKLQLKAAFDDGVSSFRAGMSFALAEFSVGLADVINQVFAAIGKVTLAGHTILDLTNAHVNHVPAFTYQEYKDKYSKDDTKAPDTDPLAPVWDATGKAVTAMLGLYDATTKLTAGTVGVMAPSATPVWASPTMGALMDAAHGLTVAGNTIQTGATALNTAATSTRSTIFGLNRDGSPDAEDNGKGYFNNPANGQSYDTRNPNLVGAAVPSSVLKSLYGLGANDVIDPNASPYVAVKGPNGAIQIAPVVDVGPGNGPQSKGVGFDSTLGLSNALGASSNAYGVQYQLYKNKQEADAGTLDANRPAWMAAATVNQAPAGNGLVPQLTAAQKALQDATQAAGQYANSVQEMRTAETEYGHEVEYANQLLQNHRLSLEQYNQLITAAQQKLFASNATYDQLAQTLGKAAANQAELNRQIAEMKPRVDMGTATTGQSLQYGAQSWVQQQGNSDQQYAKLVSGSLDTVTNDASNFFSTMSSGSVSAAQAFKQFASSILKDIANLIIKMLILKAVQSAVGYATGGGDSFTGAEADDIYGAAQAHTGGVVGGGLSTRYVNPSIFIGAPRYHNGLAGDEFPAILQRGETVLPRGVSQSTGGGTSYRGGDVYQITTPITYHEGTKDADSKQDSNESAQNMRDLDKIVKRKVNEGIQEYQRQRLGGSRKN